MSKFMYTARNMTTGESSGGSLVASDERALALQLRVQALSFTHKNDPEFWNLLHRFADVNGGELVKVAREVEVRLQVGNKQSI